MTDDKPILNFFLRLYATNRALLPALFILALIPRVGLVLSLDPKSALYTDPFYEQMARNFAYGHGLRSNKYHYEGAGDIVLRSFRPPLFPLLWGIVYKVTDGAYTPIRLAHAVLSALTCLLVFFIGETLFSRSVGTVASALSAWYPRLVWDGVHLMTEPLFIFFLVLTLLLLFRIEPHGSQSDKGEPMRRAILKTVCAGVSAALATLSRSVSTGFVPFVCVWLLLRKYGCSRIRQNSGAVSRRSKKQGLILSLSFLISFCAAMSPWIVRNWIVHGAFVPTTTDGGHGFYVGNNEKTLGDPRGFYWPERWDDLKGLTEVQIDKHLYRKGLRFIYNNPGTWLKLMIDKFKRFWRFYPHAEFISGEKAYKSGVIKTRLYVYAAALPYIALFPFIVIGGVLAFRGARRKSNIVLIYLLVFYMTLIHCLFLAVLRYRLPLMPFLLTFAAYSICRAIGCRGKVSGQ